MKKSADILWTVSGFGEEQYPVGKTYERNNRLLPHKSLVTFHYTIRGTTEFRQPTESWTVPAGGLIICRHREPSSYWKKDPDTDYACLWMNLDGAGLAEHCDLLRDRYGSVFKLGEKHPMLRGIRRLCAMAASRELVEPLVMTAAIHRLIMGFFAQGEEGFYGNFSPVNAAIHRIVSTPLYNWNIKELAAQCGCSREYLSRKFSERYGQSPHEYLVRRRGERALNLLRYTTLPLSAIAAQTGFPSAPALARQIRNMTGKPPQQHRPDKEIAIMRGRLTGLYDESQLDD
ncbi:MAG: helix-turn-helix domain-containing protein [Kiritimatiellales bacterium]